jgi:predicted secreted hydrolase
VRALFWFALVAVALAARADYAPVLPGYSLSFPEDEGAHPEFRIEWWYVTGWLQAPDGPLGFQVTFFRARTASENPSRFAPRQVIIAHAALSNPEKTGLLHDERSARAAFGLAGASAGRTDVWIDDWSLRQEENEYEATVPAREFSFKLRFRRTQPPLLQGVQGFSRKGPKAESASYYYSLPQLEVSGAISHGGKTVPVTGKAWLDHEWTSQYMDEQAVGWDWIGINFADGGALMAFRMRDGHGGARWAAGTYRNPAGEARTFNPDEIEFIPLRTWQSSRTATRYPVEWRVRAGDMEIKLEPLMNDQELDARNSSGTVYYEGAVRALKDGEVVGRGYLELTGYWRKLEL